MSFPQNEDHRSPAEKKTTRASLHDLNEEIMSLWEARVRGEVNAAGSLLRPALRNTLSKFLDLLSVSFSELQSRGMQAEATNLVKGHAQDRARDTAYGPTQIIQELQVLREVVTSTLERELHLSEQDYETIQKTFDQAIQESLTEFFLMHASLREQFVATLSHDLRGPLSVAKMGAQLSKRIAETLYDRERGSELERQLDRVTKSLRRADRMIQELLDASALKMGEKIPLHLRACNLLALVQEAVSEQSEAVSGRIQVIGKEIQGFWDPDGLLRTIENLITNALKYGGKNSPITIAVAAADKRVRLSVHNEGNPISESDQATLFMAFHRGKTAVASGQKGWGIGLALAHAVAESMGGSIGVKSSPEEGTTFTIDLPLDARIEAGAHGLQH